MQKITSFIIILLSFFLASCNHAPTLQDSAPQISTDFSNTPDAVPKYLPKSRYGNPPSYVALGHHYTVLKSSKGYHQRGIASWYGTKFHGKLTSTREPYNMFAMTAASPILALPCFVRVTNLENHRHVIVKVNDRGPFKRNRILDLSYAAAEKLGFANHGTALVDVRAITPDNPNPSIPMTNISNHPKLFLQVGAFHNQQNALKLQNKVESLTHELVQIKKRLVNNKMLYRVQIGPLENVAQSDKIYKLLKQKGFEKAITVVS